jgi:mannosidase alpha-like ER degradation enhancer 1
VFEGECTFVEKLRRVAAKGAGGVLVVSDDELPINPSYDEKEDVSDLQDVILLVLPWSTGERVLEFMDFAARHESEVLFHIEHEETLKPLRTGTSSQSTQEKTPRQFLYLGNRPILNMLIKI